MLISPIINNRTMNLVNAVVYITAFTKSEQILYVDDIDNVTRLLSLLYTIFSPYRFNDIQLDLENLTEIIDNANKQLT